MNFRLDAEVKYQALEAGAILVLHRLRIVGVATGDALATATGLSNAELAAHLDSLEKRSLVGASSRLPGGKVITAQGREAHGCLLHDAIYPAPLSGRAYQKFSVLNDEFKSVCTAWQLGPDGSPNTHSDPDYDQSVLARLWVVHDAIAVVIQELAQVAVHLEHYAARLSEAAHRVAKGDRSALAFPLSDSYHDIWMELHQDLRLGVAAAGVTPTASALRGA